MWDESGHTDVLEQMTYESISRRQTYNPQYVKPTDMRSGLTVRVADLPVVLMDRQVWWV